MSARQSESEYEYEGGSSRGSASLDHTARQRGPSYINSALLNITESPLDEEDDSSHVTQVGSALNMSDDYEKEDTFRHNLPEQAQMDSIPWETHISDEDRHRQTTRDRMSSASNKARASRINSSTMQESPKWYGPSKHSYVPSESQRYGPSKQSYVPSELQQQGQSKLTYVPSELQQQDPSKHSKARMDSIPWETHISDEDSIPWETHISDEDRHRQTTQDRMSSASNKARASRTHSSTMQESPKRYGPSKHSYVPSELQQQGPSKHSYVPSEVQQQGPSKFTYVPSDLQQQSPSKHSYVPSDLQQHGPSKHSKARMNSIPWETHISDEDSIPWETHISDDVPSESQRYGPIKKSFVPRESQRYGPSKQSYVPIELQQHGPSKHRYVPSESQRYGPSKHSFVPRELQQYGPSKHSYDPTKLLQHGESQLSYIPSKAQHNVVFRDENDHPIEPNNGNDTGFKPNRTIIFTDDMPQGQIEDSRHEEEMWQMRAIEENSSGGLNSTQDQWPEDEMPRYKKTKTRKQTQFTNIVYDPSELEQHEPSKQSYVPDTFQKYLSGKQSNFRTEFQDQRELQSHNELTKEDCCCKRVRGLEDMILRLEETINCRQNTPSTETKSCCQPVKCLDAKQCTLKNKPCRLECDQEPSCCTPRQEPRCSRGMEIDQECNTEPSCCTPRKEQSRSRELEIDQECDNEPPCCSPLKEQRYSREMEIEEELILNKRLRRQQELRLCEEQRCIREIRLSEERRLSQELKLSKWRRRNEEARLCEESRRSKENDRRSKDLWESQETRRNKII